MDTLPNELIQEIASNLSIHELTQLCRSNYAFSGLCRDWNFMAYYTAKNLHIKAEDFYVLEPSKYRNMSNFKLGVTPIQRYNQIYYLLTYPTANFIEAVINGNVEDVKILYPYVKDFPVLLNNGLINAIRNNNLDMVNYLLTLPNVYPNVEQDTPIISAIKNGNAKIVKSLLAHPSFKPISHTFTINLARKLDYPDILDILSNDPRYNFN